MNNEDFSQSVNCRFSDSFFAFVHSFESTAVPFASRHACEADGVANSRNPAPNRWSSWDSFLRATRFQCDLPLVGELEDPSTRVASASSRSSVQEHVAT